MLHEIKVPGKLDESWTDGDERMTVAVKGEGLPVTTLTGKPDRAALHSILRRFYSLGLPLISVHYVELGSEDEQ